MSNTTKKYLDYTGLSTIADKIKGRLEKVTTMPASPSNGDAVLYTGTTTANYTRGLVYIYDSSTTSWVPSGSTWGSIGGTLSDQTDLNTALSGKADKTDLDTWVGPSYVNSNYQVIFDNLDDTQAYKLFSKDRIIRIDGQPTKTTGTTTGTVKVTYTTDAPNNTECWLRKIKK